jgi:predicted DCC family thiol-disulfide oxidoreductase YuxK
MGWTGVQYSIYRTALAVAVAHVCWTRMSGSIASGVSGGPTTPLFALGLLGSVALAIGWRDRAVAINLLVLVLGLAAVVDGAPLILPELDVIVTGSLLVLHLFTPVTPFGSWDARGRIDPRGDWSRPAWLGDAAWLWLAVLHGLRAISHLGDVALTTAELEFGWLSAVTVCFEAFFVAACFRRRWRPLAWIALTLWLVGSFAAFGLETGDLALLVLHAFAADPGWWPGRSLAAGTRDVGSGRVPEPARLFYDGDCGFCHRSVRLILSEEANTPESLRLRFAPLQGEQFARLVAAREELDVESLPDSIVLCREDGRLLTRSAAALEIASRLGGLWRGLALAFGVLPGDLLDRAYDGVARIRKRLFASPKDACPILPADLRRRFDL